MTELGHHVDIADPYIGEAEAHATYGRGLSKPGAAQYDLVIGAVRHDQYAGFDSAALGEMLTPRGTLADIKGMWRRNALATSVDYWTL